MKNFSSFGFAVAATAAIVLLTACSNAGSTVAPPALNAAAGAQSSGHSVESFNSPNPPPSQLAYVSDAFTSTVNVYKQSNAQLLYTIPSTSGLRKLGGLFVDHLHQLWVANSSGQNILVFPKGATTANNILNDPTGIPIDVTVCPNGTVYVSNEYDSAAPGGLGDVVYYNPGSTTVSGQLVYPGQAQDAYLTCTPGGDVYTTLTDSAGVGRIVKYPGGAQAGATQLPIALLSPGGIKRDNVGRLVVDDPSANTVTEYTIAGVQMNQIGTGSGDWTDIAITQNGETVLGADAAQHVGRRRALWAGNLVSPPYTGFLAGSTPYGAAFDPGQAGLG